jgi:hypothetical protein
LPDELRVGGVAVNQPNTRETTIAKGRVSVFCRLLRLIHAGVFGDQVFARNPTVSWLDSKTRK